jgi:hypothetical protein
MATARLVRMGAKRKGQYAAMTVNERLGVAGLFQQFDEAVSRSDRSKMIEILCSVEIDAEQASRTADSILTNRKYYGFPE